jgi:hypothetical protein
MGSEGAAIEARLAVRPGAGTAPGNARSPRESLGARSGAERLPLKDGEHSAGWNVRGDCPTGDDLLVRRRDVAL